MALCRITGIVYLPSGEIAARREVTFVKEPDSVTADYLGAVLPEPIRTRTDNDGSIDLTLITGNYYGFILSRGGHNKYTFRAIVPEATTADFADLIAAVDPVEPLPSWLQQVIDARDEVRLAADAAVSAKDAAQIAQAQAEAARDAAASTGLINRGWVANAAALSTITSPVLNDTAMTLDNEHVWRWNGSAWVDQGQSPLALKADQAALTAGLALKADKTAVTASLALKADQTALTDGLALKANQTALTAEVSARESGDKRWPPLVSANIPLSYKHVHINDDNQVVAYDDAEGRSWAWDKRTNSYLSSALTSDLDRWPSFPIPYVNPSWRHVQLSETNQVIAYIDGNGIEWLWSTERGDYYNPLESAGSGGGVAILSPYNLPIAWSSREAIGVMKAQILSVLDYNPVPPTPAVEPAGSTGIPHWVIDEANYGKYVSQQIPKVAETLSGNYLYRAEYGTFRGTDGEILPPGAHGEAVPCFVRVSRFDLRVAGSLDQEPEYVASVIGTNPDQYNRGVIDPMLQILHDGRMLICVPTVGGGLRSAWAAVIDNPDAAVITTGDLGPWSWIGNGFVGRPRWHGEEVRMTVNQPGEGGWSDYIRIKVIGNVVVKEHIARVPAPADGSILNFQEASVVAIGMCEVLYTMRTTAGPYQSISPDGGYTWPIPTPMPDASIWSGRNTLAEMARSPSGRLIFAHNHNTGSRRDMAIAVSTDDGVSWPIWHILDPRVTGNTSYPSLAFGRLPDGTYNGWIYLAYDSGRGRIEDPVQPGHYINDLIIALVLEDSLLTENPVFTIHELDGSYYEA